MERSVDFEVRVDVRVGNGEGAGAVAVEAERGGSADASHLLPASTLADR